MAKPILINAPRYPTRTVGIIYLLYFVIAIIAEVFNKGLVISGNAAATANSILAHQTLYRLGFATGLIGTALYIVMAALFYELFKPVNKSISLVAAFLSLTGGIIQAMSSLLRLAPLVVLGGSNYLNTFKKEQLQTLALLFLTLRDQSTNIELVFFGFYDVLLGYLIIKSIFVPRVLGWLMVFAGLGWLCVLAPPVKNYMSPYMMIIGFVAEFSLMLWLIFKRTDSQVLEKLE